MVDSLVEKPVSLQVGSHCCTFYVFIHSNIPALDQTNPNCAFSVGPPRNGESVVAEISGT